MINNINSVYFAQYSQQVPVYAQKPIQNQQVYSQNVPTFSHYPTMLQNHYSSIPYALKQSTPIRQNQSIDPHSVVPHNSQQVNWANPNQHPNTHNPYYTTLPSINYVSVAPQTGTLYTVTNYQPDLTYTNNPQTSISSPKIQNIPDQNIKFNQFYDLSVQSKTLNYENPPSNYRRISISQPDPYSFLSKDLSQKKASSDILPDPQKSPKSTPSFSPQLPTLKMGRIEIVTNQSISTQNENFKEPLIQKPAANPKSLSEFEDFEETFTNLFAIDNENLNITTANSENMDTSPDITSPTSEKMDLSSKSDSSQKVIEFEKRTQQIHATDLRPTKFLPYFL